MTNKTTETKKKRRPKSRAATRDAVSTRCLVRAAPATSTTATPVPKETGLFGSVGAAVLGPLGREVWTGGRPGLGASAGCVVFGLIDVVTVALALVSVVIAFTVVVGRFVEDIVAIDVGVVVALDVAAVGFIAAVGFVAVDVVAVGVVAVDVVAAAVDVVAVAVGVVAVDIVAASVGVVTVDVVAASVGFVVVVDVTSTMIVSSGPGGPDTVSVMVPVMVTELGRVGVEEGRTG